MNSKKIVSWAVVAVALAAAAGCATQTDAEPNGDEANGQQSSSLINNGGGLGVDGDSCSITGGPLKGSTGTRSGDFCCTEPNGGGHCQDCTTPSGWCSETIKVRPPIYVPTRPIGTAVFVQ